jgi:CRISPR-associated endonuclease Csn1
MENVGSFFYTLGLDIGIASVGWCLLGTNRIIDLGVRTFDKAETAKEGESLNKIRRDSRLARRRLYHRAWRLKKLARLLKSCGLVASAQFFHTKNMQEQTPGTARETPWQLRVAALDRCLDVEEWARVIYHLCKHRGFHWASRAEEKKATEDASSEGGKVKQGLAGTRKRMEEKNYRSAAEMVLAEFPDAQRNKQGEYNKALSRVLLASELEMLFERQRELGNPYAGLEFEAKILGAGDRKTGLFWEQKPALSGKALLKMLGKCTFEKEEYRAPKAAFTAERHVWLTRLNNLRIVVDGFARPLNSEERKVALLLPYQYADGKLTYKQLASALDKSGLLEKSAFRFAGLAYPSETQKAAGKSKDPESGTLVELKAWRDLGGLLKKAGLENEWKSLSGRALNGEPETLDRIAWILSVYKDDDEAARELEKLPLPASKDLIEALLDIRFDKFHRLSLKALYKIVPRMERGLRYDEAVADIPEYGHHSQLFKVGGGEEKYLPPFYSGRDKTGRMLLVEDIDAPRNPVVLRALNQARKVVNAIIRKYGSPASVHIEMARDLSRDVDERREIARAQEQYRERNEQDKAEFTNIFDHSPTGKEFEKSRLYREQHGKCAYSLEMIDIDRLLEPGYVEVDHILPYSRSFDDSKNNKVLVFNSENRNKGNRTPYEYLGGAENSPRWQAFKVIVESSKSYRQAKCNRLLRKDFSGKDAEGFRDRNLIDTRYICRFFKNFVERYLKLAEDSESRRCVVLSGQTTAYLRAHWGLVKVREENDRHHALDAAVIAACSHGMVKRLADYAKHKELKQIREDFIDPETGEIVDPVAFARNLPGFPEPWPHFRHELEARLKIDEPALLREEIKRLDTYSAEALESLHSLFVSRAPQRRNGGAAHKDTIYGQPERLKAVGSVTQKVPLARLRLQDIDNLIDPHRNARLYQAIRERLEAHDGKGDKAFSPENPLRKPDREGKPTGPIVRTVTMVIDKLSGIPIRGGIAKNDTMLRVDVFRKAGRFFLVPVYVHHRVAGLPNRAIVSSKDESDWTLIDDSFEWCFSLHPNDLTRVTTKEATLFGYYAGTDRSTGAISLWVHDRSRAVGKDGLIRGIGVKTARNIEKFNVDVLGAVYPALKEARRGLA